MQPTIFIISVYRRSEEVYLVERQVEITGKEARRVLDILDDVPICHDLPLDQLRRWLEDNRIEPLVFTLSEDHHLADLIEFAASEES